MKRQDSDSKRNIDDRSMEKLLLALNQATDSMNEAISARRAVDTKIYELMALSLTLLALLITIKPWSSKGGLVEILHILAFAAYGITATIGFWKYRPIKSFVPDARAITESLDSSYPNLVKWTTEDLLEFADQNYKIAHEKASAHSKMWYAFLIATALLVLGALLY